MTKDLKHISLEEFVGNVARFFKQVIDDHEAVVVEDANGEGVMVGPLPATTTKSTFTDEEYRAFRSAFGGWADVDTDSLKNAIYESRQSSRPPVNL